MSKIKIYPTLIDSYKYFLKSEYMTLDEMLDRINRVPRPTTLPMAKGSYFNDLIDRLANGEHVESYRSYSKGVAQDVYLIKTEEHGDLTFKKEVADFLSSHVKGAITQVFSKADIKTPYGDVELYGYADYVKRDTVFELKTAGRYTFPAHMDKMQHKFYLYTLRNSGVDVVKATYLITDFNNCFREDYYWSEKMEGEIVGDVMDFLDFVNRYRDKITDKKILGE